ncbi:hypothetical protein [Parapedobacter sp. 2B3]|uniref:hypothetical protein n=1 Tax=Parapedobacter sp. 2B3 TaxID=3342381 RepID=UPI0035B5980E
MDSINFAYERGVNEFNIYSPAYIRSFLAENYSRMKVKSVIPYSFTVGSDNNGEDLPKDYHIPNSLFFGFFNLSVNPNDNALQPEKIEIQYRSYFNIEPYMKRITRYVEQENLINENSQSIELFDLLELNFESTKYDTYFTFVGYKIDIL